MATNGRREVTGWVGWVYFAGLLMVIMGFFQMVAGLAALLKDEVYVLREENLVVFDYTTWGWVHLALGVVVMAAGTAVVSGQMWGRVVGVLLAVFSIVANFTFVEAYPVWSIIIMIVDILIIYALTVHGAEARE